MRKHLAFFLCVVISFCRVLYVYSNISGFNCTYAYQRRERIPSME